MADYAVPELLVDTAWLADHLDNPNIRVIEMMQNPAAFTDGHIPGALVSPDWQIKGAENTQLVAPPDEAKAWFEAVGINDDTLVIGYDRFGNRDAARLWWVLNYYGHDAVKVLNGGWTKWNLEGRVIETGASAADSTGFNFTPRDANHDIGSTVDKLKAAVGRDDTVIWDLRSDDEYSGANARGNAHAGHVTGAVHLEWTSLINEDQTFKSADDLHAMLEPLGITYEKTIHTY